MDAPAHRVASVAISGHEIVPGNLLRKAFTRYHVQVTLSGGEAGESYAVFRRYKQFEELHSALQRLSTKSRPGALPTLSKPTYGGGVTDAVIAQRTKELSAFLEETRQLSSDYPSILTLLLRFLAKDAASSSSKGGTSSPTTPTKQSTSLKVDDSSPASPEPVPAKIHSVDTSSSSVPPSGRPPAPFSSALPPRSGGGGSSSSSSREDRVARMGGAAAGNPAAASSTSATSASGTTGTLSRTNSASALVRSNSETGSLKAKSASFRVPTRRDSASSIGRGESPSPAAAAELQLPTVDRNCGACKRVFPYAGAIGPSGLVYCSRQCEVFSSVAAAKGFAVGLGQDGVMQMVSVKDGGAGGGKDGSSSAGGTTPSIGNNSSNSSAAADGGNQPAAATSSSNSWWSSVGGSPRNSGGVVATTTSAGAQATNATSSSPSKGDRVAAAIAVFEKTKSPQSGPGQAQLQLHQSHDENSASAAASAATTGTFLLPGARKPKDTRTVLTRYASPTKNGSGIGSTTGAGGGSDRTAMPQPAVAAAAAAAAVQQLQRSNTASPGKLLLQPQASISVSGLANDVSAGTVAAGASSSIAEVLHHRGLMWKQGGFRGGRKSWKCRSFELRGRSLYYYRTSRPVLLGTMTLITEPPEAVLLAAAEVILTSGYQIDPYSPEFAETLWEAIIGTQADGGRHRYFPDISELAPEVAQAQLGLPPELLKAAKEVPPETARSLGLRHSGPYVFCVTTSERSLFLGCETPQAYVEWLAALKTLVSNQQQRLLAIVRAALPSSLLLPQQQQLRSVAPSPALPPSLPTAAGGSGFLSPVVEGSGNSNSNSYEVGDVAGERRLYRSSSGTSSGGGDGGDAIVGALMPLAAADDEGADVQRRSIRGFALPASLAADAAAVIRLEGTSNSAAQSLSTVDGAGFLTPARQTIPSRAYVAQAASAAASAVAARLQGSALASGASSLQPIPVAPAIAVAAAGVVGGPGASPASTLTIFTPGQPVTTHDDGHLSAVSSSSSATAASKDTLLVDLQSPVDPAQLLPGGPAQSAGANHHHAAAAAISHHHHLSPRMSLSFGASSPTLLPHGASSSSVTNAVAGGGRSASDAAARVPSLAIPGPLAAASHSAAAAVAAAAAAASAAAAGSLIQPTSFQSGSAAASAVGTGTAGGGGGSAAAVTSAVSQLWEITEDDLEVVDRIGTGSYGEVYRGRLWGTDVAVKLLPQEAATPEVLESLKAEVAILSQLRHPNVVLYLGACTSPPNIFICLEWCERGSLHDLLYDHTVPLSVATRLGLALQTARGMAYLHTPRLRIIHRDLKSKNLLITRGFAVKVADFGLTIMRQKNSTSSSSSSSSGTAGGSSSSSSSKAEPTLSTPRAASTAADLLPPLPPPGTARRPGREESTDRLLLMSSAARDRGASDAAAAGDLLQLLSTHRHGAATSAHDATAAGAAAGAGGPMGSARAGNNSATANGWAEQQPSAADVSGGDGEAWGMQGTPQWMAPEVLENARYNGAVDIYSFGIVLCEITSRVLPFSDQYRRFDFIEAVLEEGAMPTIPRWCGNLQEMDNGGSSDDVTQTGGTSLGGAGGDEDEDAAAAVGPDGLPWGWKEDLRVMSALLPSTGDAAAQPLIGGVSCAHSALVAAHGGGGSRSDVTGSGGIAHPPLTRQDSSGSDVGGLPPPLLRSRSSTLELQSPRPGFAVSGGNNNGNKSQLLQSPASRRRATVDESMPHALPGSSAAASGSAAAGSAVSGAMTSGPVLGGINEWRIPRGECTGVLRGVIVACLSRDPEARPSFEDLVDLFTALLDRPPRDLFLQLELPRLREALAYGSDTDAAVAANEVVHFASHALFTCLAALPTPSSSSTGARPVVTLDSNADASLSAADGANESGAKRPQTGLIPRFTPYSLAFYPLLPFASTPSSTMSQMHSTPYIEIGVVVEAGPQLVAGLAARLRTTDLAIRLRLGLPLFCPDLPTAASVGPAAGGLIVLRDSDVGVPGRSGVHVPGYPTGSAVALTALRGSSPNPASTAGSSGSRPYGSASGSVPDFASPGAAARNRAAARAAAARAEEERRQRRAAVSASAHIVHAISVLLQVLDAASPPPTAVSEDTGAEVGTAEGGSGGFSASLPPTGSVDRLLMSQASRLVYPLATIVACNALSPTEHAFITRPTGGPCQFRYTTQACSFPQFPDFGTDAAATAASLLRQLWARLPLLRGIIAHVVSVTSLATAMAMGAVNVTILRGASSSPSPASASGAGNSNNNSSSSVDGFSVTVPDEVVLARYLGVVVDRLQQELGAGEGGRTAVGVGGGKPLADHPLVNAVTSRLLNSSVQRADGVVLLGSIEVEEYDETLCN